MRTFAAGRPAAVLLVLLAGVWAGCGEAGDRAFLSIGTGGTGGIYYPLGGALASLLSVSDPARQYTAEVTGGSVENLNRLREGQIDLGFSLGVSIHEAYTGGEGEPFRTLRIAAPLYPNLLHILVPRGSKLTSVRDLAGKRVSVGSAGSGTEQVSRQLLAAYGLDYDDVQVRYLSFSESSAAIRDGAVDAAILSVGYPAAAVLEATATGGARLLPLDEEAVRRLVEAHPYYAPASIPAGTYPGVEEAVPTVSMMNWIVAREDLDGEVVRSLLNILRDERVSLERVHEMVKRIDLSALDSPPVPLHPAALRWWEEVGGGASPGDTTAER